MYQRRSQANRHRVGGRDARSRDIRQRAGEKQGIPDDVSSQPTKAPAWYEQLFQGGSKARQNSPAALLNTQFTELSGLSLSLQENITF